MKEWAKNTFVPRPENGHYPRFWRGGSLAALAVAAAVLAGAWLAAPALVGQRSFLSAILPGAIVSLTNEERAELAVPALAESAVLAAAAQAKADDMAARGYFAHYTPEGRSPWYWLDQAGYAYQRAGENLAVNFSDSEDVVDAWMRSPTHRANIAKGTYSEIGVAMARGEFEGKRAVFVVQFFGTPKAGTASIAAVPPDTASSSAVAESAASATPIVAGASIESVAALAASPRSAARPLLWGLFSLVAIAFALAVIVKPKIQFRSILLAGAALLLALGGLLAWDTRASAPETLLGGRSATSTER